MIDPSALRFTALREFHIDRGPGRLVAVMFQLAPSAPVDPRDHSGSLASADALGEADDLARGASMPNKFGEQLLDGNEPELARPPRRFGGLSHDGGDSALNRDRGLFVVSVLHPVVDVSRRRLALNPSGELGLGTADSNGAL
ncbi:hypothetical protein U4I65_08545 [Stenotrophomonas maltophilia]|uniref:hypothetical protein n=1 Tax=Stenotrophomonas maltophilia TaxID=40324 RepID=UPI002ACCECFE|nr:hypothetical protein [Stenotrophomonas maltophilia]MDZ5815080.1 hypothetical protein [Stenotrophomonas maltophilia]